MQTEMAILMADLSGYTAMTEMHGPQSAAAIINRYLELADKAMYGSSRLLERVGDQLVIVSPNANDLAVTALELLEFCAHEPNFLPVHAGLHYGTIIEQNGSFYGSVMNVTARIAAKAKDGSILCSAEFMEKANSEGVFNFRVTDKVKLKNILHPVTLVELLPGEKFATVNKTIDPVCLMQVDKSTGFHYVYNDHHYYFCSDQCLQVFRHDPEVILNRE
jgi:adenylate cyclase